MMKSLIYLSGYPQKILDQAFDLVENNRLGEVLLSRYPLRHSYRSDKSLYQFANEIKNQFLRNGPALNKVSYDSKIQTVKQALGIHQTVSRVQGNSLKMKTEIRISSLFKEAPEPFLRMIIVHELAHIREKLHNKAFYQLCCYMEPKYPQLELDTRLYLTYLDLFGPLYK